MGKKIIVNDKEFEIISYISNENGNYIVYTDGKELDNGKVPLYINALSMENDELRFDELDNEDLNLVMNSLNERLKINV